LLEFLRAGGDGVVEVPDDRWSIERYFDEDPSCSGRMHTRFGGFLRGDVFAFDASAFGISPREAAAIDPQQALLLEVAWESLEDAGIPVHSLAGSSTGVFVGAFGMDNVLHGQSYRSMRAISSHTHLTSATLLSARIAYALDLRGPAFTVDTACSSSLVAAHLACVALHRRECDAALVGGVHVMSMPAMLVSLSKGHFVAPDGRSKAFDASANGYGRGEGAVALTLKRLDDAIRDGDRVYSVLLASGVNQDGRTEGITVPSVDAQAALIRRVCGEAAISLADVG
jgi:acyl transferase domain-containing protein